MTATAPRDAIPASLPMKIKPRTQPALRLAARFTACIACLLPLAATIVLATLSQGCESAESYAVASDIAPSEGGGENHGGDSDTPDNGGGSSDGYQTLAVAPATATLQKTSGSNTSQINFVDLSITPRSGYTYQWAVSDTSLGRLSQSSGDRVQYTASSYPSSGSAVQTVTVIGTSPGSSVRYRGTATITHLAP